jgi:integrase
MAVYRYQNSKIWWMDFIFDGVRIRESTKSRNRKLAEDIERKRRTDLETGRMGIKKRGRPRLFSLASEDYLLAKQPVLSDRAFIIERSNLKHLLPFFGAKLLSDIDAADVDQYQKARLREGAAPKTINLEVGTLRAILVRNRLWEPIRHDIRMLKVEDSPGKALTAEEEAALVDACRESRSRGLYPSVVLALNTGMRSAELRYLRWKQVDLHGGSIRVGRSKTAAGTGRAIPLNRRALETLREWAAQFDSREPEHFVFPSEKYGHNGVPYASDASKPMGSLKEGWEIARKRAGIQCRFHDLRHTACTRLLEGGVPFAILAQIMGWSASATITMAKRYGHIGDSSLRRAMSVLDFLDHREERREIMTEKSPELAVIAGTRMA